MAEDPPPDLTRIYETYHDRVVAYAARLLGRDAARRASGSRRLFVSPDSGQGDGGEDVASGVQDTGGRSPEEGAIRNEMVACYLDYVRQLSPTYHEAFILSEFEDLSIAEIGRHLSLSVGTVKIRLHQARTRLHGELRRNCSCYYDERGELMGEPRSR